MSKKLSERMNTLLDSNRGTGLFWVDNFSDWVQKVAALEAKLEAMERLRVRYCIWTENEDGYYDTDCDQSFVLNDGGPLAPHGFKFCVYCGRPITEKPYVVAVEQDQEEQEDVRH